MLVYLITKYRQLASKSMDIERISETDEIIKHKEQIERTPLDWKVEIEKLILVVKLS